jgi:hypothetical protein
MSAFDITLELRSTLYSPCYSLSLVLAFFSILTFKKSPLDLPRYSTRTQSYLHAITKRSAIMMYITIVARSWWKGRCLKYSCTLALLSVLKSAVGSVE